MADLVSALERLSRAVDRLENAAEAHLPHCNEDRRQLTEALMAAQSELARLTEVNDNAVDRLDGAIDTIRSTLKGG